MKFSPIILFVYNRPWHTQQTLNALAQNPEAKESLLYIYCDGAKPNANFETIQQIETVRNIAKAENRFKDVIITIQQKNKGLANSIIDGITEVINKHGKIIVLEDDIVTSIGFLRYMNQALNIYENDEQVMHISGYWFPTKNNMSLPNTFFYNTASCWGWATWARAWSLFERDTTVLHKTIKSIDPLFYRFNKRNSYPFHIQLEQNLNGKINTWAIKWYSTIFINNGFSLHPNHSFVNNIGWGDDATHTKTNGKQYYWETLAQNITVERIPLIECEEAIDQIKQLYKQSIFRRISMKKFIKLFIPPIAIKLVSALKNRMVNIPRFTETRVKLLDKTIKIPDIASFKFIKNEIFDKEIYKFKAETNSPFIIDCGANIGLSVIYLKKLYPHAEIIAFEPDEKIFAYLKYNTQNVFDLNNVELVKKGLWKENTTISFYEEGADGGRIDNKQGTTTIQTVLLSDYLKTSVDLLKIDIEGAEIEVISECKDYLKNVKNIFVEFHSMVDKQQRLGLLLNILENAGFRYYISHVGINSHQPFIKKNVEQNMDNQLNIWATRQ